VDLVEEVLRSQALAQVDRVRKERLEGRPVLRGGIGVAPGQEHGDERRAAERVRQTAQRRHVLAAGVGRLGRRLREARRDAHPERGHSQRRRLLDHARALQRRERAGAVGLGQDHHDQVGTERAVQLHPGGPVLRRPARRGHVHDLDAQAVLARHALDAPAEEIAFVHPPAAVGDRVAQEEHAHHAVHARVQDRRAAQA
jgi:hypothetical protein